MKATPLVIIAFILGASGAVFAQSKATPLAGAWRIIYSQFTGPNGRTTNNPQPGLYLFTANYYSNMAVTSDKPRPALANDASKASAAELNATWGKFTANSGTYEIRGDMLTIHPIVAKNPNVMASGSVTTLSFKIEGTTLTLRADRSPLFPDGYTLKLERLE
jgi:Lipocalin-like domain